MPCQLPRGHMLSTASSPGGQRSRTGAKGLVGHQLTRHQPEHTPAALGGAGVRTRHSRAQPGTASESLCGRQAATALWGGRGGSLWGLLAGGAAEVP